jgi:hypothetical protein
MRLLIACAIASSLCASSIALAQTSAAAPAAAAAPHAGDLIVTADGKRVGPVYYIDKAKDGTPDYVGVIYDNRMVHIPVSSLSPGQKGFTTSLKRAEVDKL